MQRYSSQVGKPAPLPNALSRIRDGTPTRTGSVNSVASFAGRFDSQASSAPVLNSNRGAVNFWDDLLRTQCKDAERLERALKACGAECLSAQMQVASAKRDSSTLKQQLLKAKAKSLAPLFGNLKTKDVLDQWHHVARHSAILRRVADGAVREGARLRQTKLRAQKVIASMCRGRNVVACAFRSWTLHVDLSAPMLRHLEALNTESQRMRGQLADECLRCEEIRERLELNAAESTRVLAVLEQEEQRAGEAESRLEKRKMRDREMAVMVDQEFKVQEEALSSEISRLRSFVDAYRDHRHEFITRDGHLNTLAITQLLVRAAHAREHAPPLRHDSPHRAVSEAVRFDSPPRVRAEPLLYDSTYPVAAAVFVPAVRRIG